MASTNPWERKPDFAVRVSPICAKRPRIPDDTKIGSNRCALSISIRDSSQEQKSTQFFRNAVVAGNQPSTPPAMRVPSRRKQLPQLHEVLKIMARIVLTNCAVRGVETTGGQVSGVVTEQGPIACGAVVIAAGAWSSLLCRSLGLSFPQLKVVASVFRTEAFDGGPGTAARGGNFAVRKRLDGGYSVANGQWNDVDLVSRQHQTCASILSGTPE